MILRFALQLAWMLLASFAAFAASPPEAAENLLEPGQAFRLSARLAEPALIEVRYRIADGYYMYRDKFHFSARPESVRMGSPKFPAGIIKQDEFFGRTETYRGELVVRLPLVSPLASGITLKATSQGCADVGVCYPPQIQNVEILAVASTTSPLSPSKKSSDLLARLRGAASYSSGAEEFLPVEKAFTMQARMPDARTAVVRFTPADGYYLYRDKIHFSVEAGGKLEVGSVQLPRGEMKKDPNFGDTEVFHQPFQAVIRLKRESAEAGRFVLKVGYQGCSEKGLCYPPETKSFPLTLAALDSQNQSAAGETDATFLPPKSAQADDQQVARLLGGGKFWLIVASFLGFGLLLSLTPCMWPMIPILSGIIAGQGDRITRGRGFALAATYVFGMALAYAVAGVAAGISGTLLSGALQNPWVLGGFALVFVGLALSMFGLYELQLPSTLQSRLSGTSNRLRGGTLTGVFLMGALSAVIVGPCVAAPLAGALLYISQSRDVLLGGSALFAMAIGMGLPLLVIGMSAGALLPRAGAWMQTVRNLFGVILLGTAIWIISPVIPAVVHMLLWAALLIVSAIYLHAIDSLPPGASGFRRLWKGIGVIALLIGVALLVGALTGGRDILQPLSGLRSGEAISTPHSPFARVRSVSELDAAVASAGRPVMLDFYADWCVSCKEMERFTFRDEQVRSRLDGMLLLQADVTANTENDKSLLARFGLFGPPGIIFFDRKGAELREMRVIGYQPAERFSKVLDTVLDQ